MNTKSRRAVPIWMIIGGLIVLLRYLLYWDSSRDNTYHIIIILCATLYISIAVFALRKYRQHPG